MDQKTRGKAKTKYKRPMSRKKKTKAVLEALQQAIETSLGLLKKNELGGTKLGELMKLIQFEKELTDESPGTINVQWIDTWESKPSSAE